MTPGYHGTAVGTGFGNFRGSLDNLNACMSAYAYHPQVTLRQGIYILPKVLLIVVAYSLGG